MEAVRKHSKKRDAILRCVREAEGHPSAEWVYHRLKPEIPDLSLGTVYRNLALFKQTGEVVSLGTVQGLERFDGCTEPHAHFICTHCGCILDLPGVTLPQEVFHQAEEQAGIQMEDCLLTFRGSCRECIKGKNF